jgi:hypothetical protein
MAKAKMAKAKVAKAKVAKAKVVKSLFVNEDCTSIGPLNPPTLGDFKACSGSKSPKV